MDFMVALSTQGNSDGSIEQISQRYLASKDVRNHFAERNLVMSMKVDGFTVAASPAAILAGVVISFENGSTPFFVLSNLAKIFMLASDTASPFMMPLPSSGSIARQESEKRFIRESVMIGKVARDSSETWSMVMWLNFDRLAASALTEVLAGILCNPPIYPLIVGAGMIAGIYAKFVSLRKGSIGVSDDSTHTDKHIRFNGDTQEKSGELLELLTGDAEDNQQPSAGNRQQYVPVKVHRLEDEDATPISLTSARQTAQGLMI